MSLLMNQYDEDGNEAIIDAMFMEPNEVKAPHLRLVPKSPNG